MRVVLGSLLALCLFLGTFAGAAEPASPSSVRVADWRVGDQWSLQHEATSTFPYHDNLITFEDRYVDRATVELGSLRYSDGDVREVVWSNRSVQIEGYERPFFSRQAHDLGTGDQLLAPWFLSYRYGPSSFDALGLGLYRTDDMHNDTTDGELYAPTPELTLHDVAGGVALDVGVEVERTFDFRPRHDVLVSSRLVGLAFEELESRTVLRAQLHQIRTENGVEGAPQTSTIWLADDVPFPVREVTDAAAYPVSYHRESNLLSFVPGSTRVPWGARSAPEPALPELSHGAYTRDGPADGPLVLDLPLSDAVALVRDPIRNPASAPPVDSMLVAGEYGTTFDDRGRKATWSLEFMTEDGSIYGFDASREFVDALPVAVDSVGSTYSGFTTGRMPEPNAASVLTVASIVALSQVFDEPDLEPDTISFYAWGAGAEFSLFASGLQTSTRSTGSASNGVFDSDAIETLFNGSTGQAVGRIWYEDRLTRSTTLAGRMYDGPRLL